MAASPCPNPAHVSGADRPIANVRARRRIVAVAAAACTLGGILVAAGVLHDGVTLAYDESGNGCQTLMEASARDLASALLPVRLLVAAWVVATGTALTAGSSRSVSRAGGSASVGGTLAFAALAVWEQAFIGTDPLSALAPLLGLWLLVLCAVVALVVSAVVRHRDALAPWLWAFVGWLLVAGGALPLALLALTTDGAIRSC
jgi:hypothetical protein